MDTQDSRGTRNTETTSIAYSTTSYVSNSSSSSCGYNWDDVRNGTVSFGVPGISALKYTERCCCICSSIKGRSRVPYLAIIEAWIRRQIFIPSKNRCYKSHLTNGIFTQETIDNLQPTKSYAEVTGTEMSKWMKVVTDQLLIARNIFDFEPNSRMSEQDFDMLVGLSKTQFEDLFSYVEKSLRNTKLRYK